jgi:cytochrome c-type biogenesis protein CcmE
MQDGVFVAREVLAKHDENYMPPEAADAIQRARRGESRLDASVVPSGYAEKQP